ncbi:MAG: IS3 family transposase [Gammaproteobacteria bacterium]
MSINKTGSITEVICSTKARRRWAPYEKHQIVQETYQPGVSISFIARKHGIPPSQLFTWRKHLENGAMAGVKSEEDLVPQSEMIALKKHIRKLEQTLGQKTLENEILREAVKLARGKKTNLAAALVRSGRFRIRAIARTLDVARSNLIEKVKLLVTRPKRYNKMDDDALLKLIKEITDARPTYGYRRVLPLLNHLLQQKGRPKINHKRLYRIMKQQGLLLQRYGKKATRTHDGKIITLKSNLRWCSDAFTIQCCNGDRVYVAFAMDTCDREIVGYIASTVGMDGESIRDLIMESVEYRFGEINKLPHRIQWLTDNGPCYTAKETVQFARNLGFEVCTTPSYSPQSNGMAEAFVKTFKRDYVWLSELNNARDVMAKLPQWFEDYNEHAPHQGLKMRSPRQYIKEFSMAG